MNNEKHVHLLCAVKAIRLVLEKVSKTRLTQELGEAPKGTRNTRDKSGNKRKNKGKYNRKDLTANKS